MKIYKAEINDGLADLISNNTVAYCAPAQALDASKTEDTAAILSIITQSSDELVERFTSAENKDQFDLFYLRSVLVSTGWNKNDDVFDIHETWAARHTAEDKPFNFMHDEKDIIGHITNNSVADFDGHMLDSNLESPPGPFNILTNAVIYKSWSDSEQRERINKLIAEIQEGKWFVSMECLFPAFDYALMNDQEETKVLPRNEASAFLTKHLRAYGGDGHYQNYKIGRLLRNLAFSGKGLVSKPANPRSIILDKNEFFDESKSQILTVSSIKENRMSDNLEKRIAELQAELDQAKADNKQLMEEISAEKQAEYQSRIDELDSVIATKTETIKSLSETNDSLLNSSKELEAAVEKLQSALDEKDQEVKELHKREVAMQRKTQLAEVGCEGDKAEKVLESFADVNDDAFEAMVELMTASYDKNKKKDKEDKDEDKETKAKIDQETDASEVGEEALENVEPVDEVSIAEVDPEVDPAESLRTAASEWIGSILQSVPKNK